MGKAIPIQEVPRDLNPTKIVQVKNPLDVPFTVKFNGEDFTVQAGDTEVMTEPVAHHFAKHLVKWALGTKRTEEEFNLRAELGDKFYGHPSANSGIDPAQADALLAEVLHPEEEREYKCQYCDETFSKPVALAGHVRKEHKEEKALEKGD